MMDTLDELNTGRNILESEEPEYFWQGERRRGGFWYTLGITTFK